MLDRAYPCALASCSSRRVPTAIRRKWLGSLSYVVVQCGDGGFRGATEFKDSGVVDGEVAGVGGGGQPDGE